MGNPYQLLLCQEGDVRKVALMDAGKLLEYHHESSENMVGSILVGRVERVLPDIKAAFVRIHTKLFAPAHNRRLDFIESDFIPKGIKIFCAAVYDILK